MTDLNVIRKTIDTTDATLLETFEKRMSLCEEVGRYKIETGKPVFDEKREEEKLQTLASLTKHAENKEDVRTLYKTILSISKKRQYEMMDTVPLKDYKACILFRNMEHGGLLETFYDLMDRCERGCLSPDSDKSSFFSCISQLIELAEIYGFTGNLWQDYLTLLLVTHENAFSLACEIRQAEPGSIHALAAHDLEIFYSLFHYEIRKLDACLDTDCCSLLASYTGQPSSGKAWDPQICKAVNQLSRSLASAETLETFTHALTTFYKTFGVGMFGLHKAFRVVSSTSGQSPHIVPVNNLPDIHFQDLIGYDIAKAELIDNTEAFLNGKKANNCLLYGDAGTGKSSSIKALLNQYYDKGLRIIEIYKHQFRDLNQIIGLIKDRNYKFILFMDDLSFEDFEIEYKYLKAVIEGGLEKRPDNILIYATSNRRHLIRERFSDKEEREDDLHKNDTIQEKLSLVSRFGVTIYFGSPDKSEFQDMVLSLAHRNGILIEEKELLLKANAWELQHGGFSGRTAQQFIDYLLGQTYK